MLVNSYRFEIEFMGNDSGSQSDAFPLAAIMLTSRECSSIGVSFKHKVFFLALIELIIHA